MGRSTKAPHAVVYRSNDKSLAYGRDHRLVYLEPASGPVVLPFKCPPHMAIVIASKLLGDGQLEATYSSGNTSQWLVKEGQLLSFNDAISHPPESVYCYACDTDFPVEQAHWYEDSSAMVWDDNMPVVPVCPSCHADPASWLPAAYSVPGYLANRPCEELDQ